MKPPLARRLRDAWEAFRGRPVHAWNLPVRTDRELLEAAEQQMAALVFLQEFARRRVEAQG